MISYWLVTVRSIFKVQPRYSGEIKMRVVFNVDIFLQSTEGTTVFYRQETVTQPLTRENADTFLEASKRAKTLVLRRCRNSEGERAHQLVARINSFREFAN